MNKFDNDKSRNEQIKSNWAEWNCWLDDGIDENEFSVEIGDELNVNDLMVD